MRNSIAKEYIYSDEVQILPEAIQRDDQVFLDHIFSYLNKNNILDVNDRVHLFKPVISATVFAYQLDAFTIKVNVLLKNDRTDWYIPRFEEKSIFSQNKIYLISKDKITLKKIPEWWAYKPRGPHEPIVYSPKPAHIGLFARFNKGDQYKLEYIVDLPKTNEEQLIFDLLYQDNTIPTEIFMKYNELYDENLPIMAIKSNIIKVSCHAIDGDVTKGFKCDFSS
ncbi:hypothetical protein [Acinetobacter larvae]|uniref:hypothetical protein n=1 Tax=Acinetobacter larvae TaxID=1789224 RepID=UPI0012FD77B0|nr:hypothetical protein [Acinetobacter larvae]